MKNMPSPVKRTETQESGVGAVPPVTYPLEVQDAYQKLWNVLAKGSQLPDGKAVESTQDYFARTGKRETTAQGQPVIVLSDMTMIRNNGLGLLRASLFSEHTFEPRLHEQLFTRPEIVMKAEDILQASYHLCGGFGAAPQSKAAVFQAVAHPLCATTVDILVAMGKRWYPETAEYFQPLRSTPHGALVPLIGDIFYRRESLFSHAEDIASPCNQILRASGFKRHKDSKPEDEPIRGRYPMFIRGGRSLILPTDSELPLLPSDFGGLRLAQTLQEFETVSDDRITRLRVVAMQYVGTGLSKYQYHAAHQTSDGFVTLDQDEVILKFPEGKIAHGAVSIVHNQTYSDKAGIFLDLKHQPHTIAPTGGMIRGERVLKHEGSLLAHGAKLGAITIGFVPLITKEEVGGVFGEAGMMPCDQVEIHAKAVIGTTYRLPVALIATQSNQEYFLKSVAHIMDLPEVGIVTKYLERLFETVGHNIKICSQLGFSVNRFENTFDDLNIFGEICDAENLSVSTNPYQLVHLVRTWLSDIVDVATAFSDGNSVHVFKNYFPKCVAKMGIDNNFTFSPEMMVANDDFEEKLSFLAVDCSVQLITKNLREHNSVPTIESLLSTFGTDSLMQSTLASAGIKDPCHMVEQLKRGANFVCKTVTGQSVLYDGEKGVAALHELLLEKFLISKCLVELKPEITNAISRRRPVDSSTKLPDLNFEMPQFSFTDNRAPAQVQELKLPLRSQPRDRKQLRRELERRLKEKRRHGKK